MIKTPQAYAIPAEKPQGTFRIFVLGESAAMGDPDPAYAFSRYLEVMLRQRYPVDEVRGGEYGQRRDQFPRAAADRQGAGGTAARPVHHLFRQQRSRRTLRARDRADFVGHEPAGHPQPASSFAPPALASF